MAETSPLDNKLPKQEAKEPVVIKPISAIAHRMFHPPKLERKHSSGDLHSRLKTRKILGVGETDNGDIHRSKISQLLGHNEHLYVKFPKGYGIWHISMALTFGLLGFINLFYPNFSFDVPKWDDDVSSTSHQSDLACRFYGCTSMALSFLFVSFWGTMDKGVVRTLLLTAGFCHSLQVLALITSQWGYLLNWRTLLYLFVRIVLVMPNAYYYRSIGFCGFRMRKSTSFNNLRDCAMSANNHLK